MMNLEHNDRISFLYLQNCLSLNYKEFTCFLNNYESVLDDIVSESEVDDLLRDCGTSLWAYHAGVCNLDECLFLKGKSDLRETFRMECYEMGDKPEDSAYVIRAENGICYDGTIPRSTQDLICREFRDCIGRYVPAEFDWNAHIGMLLRVS